VSAGGGARIGRLGLTLFLGIVAFSVAQLGWWVYFLLRLAPDRRHAIMFASEGAVFLLALLAGVFLIYRALAQQVRLHQMRTTFLSAVTHELKSPLASIRLYLETLEAGRVPDEKQGPIVAKMLDDVSRLERLVTDLLRAGELESGRLKPRSEDLDVVDLTSVARGVVDDARARLLEPGDELTAFLGPGVPVEGDRQLIRSVVENLLENAVKYSPAPRRIEVHAATRGGSAVLRVSDRGIGVDPDTAESLFEPFHRGGDELTRRAKGTGLGLFLVRGICEAHGGSCEVASAGPGQGTTVTCRLPLYRTTGGGGGDG
jgi:signal transduction histidine kinase